MNKRRDEEEEDFELFENVHLKIKEDKKTHDSLEFSRKVNELSYLKKQNDEVDQEIQNN